MDTWNAHISDASVLGIVQLTYLLQGYIFYDVIWPEFGQACEIKMDFFDFLFCFVQNELLIHIH